MSTTKTVTKSFKDWMVDSGYGVFGENIFINQFNTEPDRAFRILTSGGAPTQFMYTGGAIKQYTIDLTMRSNFAEDIEDTLFMMETEINKQKCLRLEGFEIISVQVTQFPVDSDIDSEDRFVGQLSITVELYSV